MPTNEEQIKFLEEQLRWSEWQMNILAEIEEKLQEMRAIAELALEKSLTEAEVNELNEKLAELTKVVHSLESQLKGIVH